MEKMLQVEWMYGRPNSATSALKDEERALAAAQKFLDDVCQTLNTDISAIYRSFVAQTESMELFFDEIEGLGALWVAAQSIADIALTEGWSDPNGASCYLLWV